MDKPDKYVSAENKTMNQANEQFDFGVKGQAF
jgi:hypothetical protein